MAVYTVELDGEQFDIEGPDDATDEELKNTAIAYKGGGETPPGAQMPAQNEPSKAHKVMKKVAEMLPTAGGIGGGIALGVPGTVFGMGVGGLPSAAAGAGIGAAGGTAAKQMILRALGETEGVPQTSGEAAKEIGWEGAKDAALTYVGGKAIGGAAKALKYGKRLVTGPGVEEARALGMEAVEGLKSAGADELLALKEAAKAAKGGLIKAEEKAGLHFASTPEFEAALRDPMKVAKNLEKLSRSLDKTPEEIAESMTPESLQNLRKYLQEAEKSSGLSDIATSQMKALKGKLVKALSISKPEIVEPLGNLAKAEEAVKELPKTIRKRIAEQRIKNVRSTGEAKSLETTRKLIKTAAKLGLAGSGLGLILGR
jgi:hypothetical protein